MASPDRRGTNRTQCDTASHFFAQIKRTPGNRWPSKLESYKGRAGKQDVDVSALPVQLLSTPTLASPTKPTRRLPDMLLFSSFTQLPSNYFEGYCFIGPDYISGDGGAAEYEQCSDRVLGPGNDGCYTIVRQKHDVIEVGTDGRGATKLYVFERGEQWAVSNSLTALVEFLRASGFRINPRPALIYALGLRRNFTQQQVTTRTVFEDIALLPTFEKLQIRNNCIARRSVRGKESLGSYTEALATHVATWKERLRTLLDNDETVMTADLTGGRDSRVCFAFAQSTGMLDITTQRMRLASNVKWTDDFRAAERIAEHYGHAVNSPIRRSSHKLSARRAVQRWYELSMGVYLPVYLRSMAREPLRIHLHGAGGGTFRPVYGSENLSAQLAPYNKHMPKDYFDEFFSVAINDFNYISSKVPDVPQMSLHYREFRNRFHFGFFPQCETLVTPLNSMLLDTVVDGRNVDAYTVYNDLMDALVPGLKSLPYDTASKLPPSTPPSEAARSASEHYVAPGSTFVGKGSVDRFDPGGNSYSVWSEMLEPRLRRTSPSEFIDTAELSVAREYLASSMHSGKPAPANSREMKILSYISVLDFAFA